MNDDIELGRITIRHLMAEDDLSVNVDVDGSAEESMLTFLGLLEMAKHYTMREEEA